MSARSRNKGKRYEQDIARRLRPLFGDGVKRGWQARGGGAEAPDIVGVPEWLHLECSHGAAPSCWAKLRQAHRDQPDPGVLKVAVVRRDGGEEMVAMRWETFQRLLVEASAYRLILKRALVDEWDDTREAALP